MGFYHPEILWALFAILLPILVHLFHLQRTKKVQFSHLPLLRIVLKTSHVHHRVRKRLLLLLRVLALACLVLAFAQPYWGDNQQVTQQKQALIYVDNSLSMQLPVEKEARAAFEESIVYAQQIVRSYPPTARFALLTNDRSALRFVLAEEILDQLSLLDYSPYSSTASTIYQRIQGFLSQQPTATDLYWLSDCQANTWLADLEADSTHQWTFIPLPTASQGNISLDTAYSLSPIWAKDVPNQLCVRVRNRDTVLAEDLALKLFTGGRLHALRTFSLVAQQSKALCFEYTPTAEASIAAYFQVEAPDPNFDNTLHMAIQRTDPIAVLELTAADPLVDRQYVAQAYGNTRRFSYRRLTLSQAASALPFEDALIVLNQIPSLSAWWVEALRDHLDKGGRLLIIPPEESPIGYEALIPGWQRHAGVTDAPAEIQTIDYADPFFLQVFTTQAKLLDMPQASALYQASLPQARVLLRLSNEDPVLLRWADKGICYVLLTPLGDTRTNLMYHALFVPIMYRIATESHTSQMRLYYATQTPTLSIAVGTEPALFALDIRSTQTIRHVPSQRHLAGQQVLFMDNIPLETGVHGLYQDSMLIQQVAFNPLAAESDLQVCSVELLRQKIQNLRYAKIVAWDEANKRIEQGAFDPPTALWRWVLGAALLFLLIEMLYVRYFYQYGQGA